MASYYLNTVQPFPTTIPVHTGDRLSQSIITADGRQVGSLVDRPLIAPQMVAPTPLLSRTSYYQMCNPA